MANEGGFIKIGSTGSKDGTPWDEKRGNKIVQMFISHDDNIKSVQFQYCAEDGNLVLSEPHGPGNGCKFDVVKLDFPSEYITWISGSKTFTMQHLVSLTIGTNHGQYGPFGGQLNINAVKEFCFMLGEDRQFAGFHGTADNNNVKSIGVYLKPIMVLESLHKNGTTVLVKDI